MSTMATSSAAVSTERDRVWLRFQTVRKALDADADCTGFALARFTLEPGDVAWNPESPPGGAKIEGPCRVTYERRPTGRILVRLTEGSPTT